MKLEDYIDVGQKVNITLWEDTGDEHGISFASYVKDMDPVTRRILVDPPPPNQEHLFAMMQPGMVVGAVLSGKKGEIIFYPSVFRLQKDGLYGHWLNIPTDFEKEVLQNRKHVRIPVTLPFQVEFRDPRTQEIQVVPASTHNLSGGGLRFSAPIQFNDGQEIIIKLNLGEQQQQLKLIANVVFSRENDSRFYQGKDKYVTACFFISLTEHQESLIIGECFRRELALRRKGLI